ncbi:MAG: hypothetical protein GY823_05270 [Flavobacteriaceae bacterium]|nr:hypothetical protein [Flavobacteriaceae bacterium]
MKNFLLFIALVSFSFASAQITTNAGTFNKPTEGETAFEFNFMPNLDGTTMFTDKANVMMRKFKSDTRVTRYKASLSVADSGVEGSDMTYGIGLGYGIENHFAGAERLSTYWGYGGLLGYFDNGTSVDVDGNEVDLTGLTVGAEVFIGADYYIIPKVYVGMELNYGLGIASSDDVTAWGLAGGVTGMMRVGFRL